MEEIECGDCGEHLGWMIDCGPHGQTYCDTCKDIDDEDEGAEDG